MFFSPTYLRRQENRQHPYAVRTSKSNIANRSSLYFFLPTCQIQNKRIVFVRTFVWVSFEQKNPGQFEKIWILSIIKRQRAIVARY